MRNPVKKFEVEIGACGVWFSEVDKDGKVTDYPARYFGLPELQEDLNYITKELQVWFNF